MIKLIDVYSAPSAHQNLYALLQEREAHVNISHREMPTWADHVNFVRSRPYSAWYLIEAENAYVGAIYLTRVREIGVQIFHDYRGRGYALEAVEQLMQRFPGRILANVAPRNDASHNLWRKLGGEIIQVTYEVRGGSDETQRLRQETGADTTSDGVIEFPKRESNAEERGDGELPHPAA